MSRKFWIRLVITVGLLGFIVARVDLTGADLGSPLRVATGVGIAVILLTVNQVFTAFRWAAILGDDAPGWWHLTRLTLVGMFFSTFLPTSVGGDAVRTWGLAEEIEKPGLAVSSVILDRGMGFAALAVYLGLGAVLSRGMMKELLAELEWSAPLWIVGVLLLGVALAVFVVRRTRASVWLRQALAHLDRFRRSGGSVVQAILLSFLVQGVYIGVWYVLARSVGFDLPVASFLLTVPVVSLGAMIPVTLSGVGIREGLWILLLARYGFESATVAAFSLFYFAAFAVTGGIGGVFYLWGGVSARPRIVEAS